MLFGITMLMVSIALVMAVIVTNIFLRKDNSKRAPLCIRRLLLRHPKRTSYHKDNHTCHLKPTENNHVVTEIKPHEIELDNISLQSETENLTCRKYNCRRSTGCAVKPQDMIDTQAQYSEEWILIAKAVDNLFFWVFLTASVIALSCIFAGIPAFNAT